MKLGAVALAPLCYRSVVRVSFGSCPQYESWLRNRPIGKDLIGAGIAMPEGLTTPALNPLGVNLVEATELTTLLDAE